jgi:hypothetical protein
MSSAAQVQAPTSKKVLWAGRIMSGLAVLFLLFDSSLKLVNSEPAIKGTVELGYAPALIVPLGLLLLICTLLYVVPSTSVLGAILLTGYLGGAVASQVRVGHPLFGFVLFPVYLGILLWGGLYCREGRIRALIPLRRLES